MRVRLLAAAALVFALVVPTAPAAPTPGANVNIDFDHGLAFPRNKQNEPSITRDPITGA